jgi:hypothetical protein
MRQLLKLYSGDFNPLSIPGLQLWLSSRYAASMLQERSSASTLAASNGDPIGTWQDLSGNSRHVTTPTSDTKRPTLGTSSQNGLPGVVVRTCRNDQMPWTLDFGTILSTESLKVMVQDA